MSQGQLDARGLVQLRVGETHMHGHMLDMVITRDVSFIIQGTPVIVDVCAYDAKGNQCDYCLVIKVTTEQ